MNEKIKSARAKSQEELRQALAYLRLGSPIGGKPVELLVAEAADAIDPQAQRKGPGGVGVTLSNLRQAMSLMTEALGCAERALVHHQNHLAHEDARRELRESRRRKTKAVLAAWGVNPPSPKRRPPKRHKKASAA